MQDVKVKFAYKTGFRRLWVVFSVAWMVLVSTVVYRESNLHFEDWLLAVLAPVAILYAIGVAFVWVIEGFARADR